MGDIRWYKRDPDAALAGMAMLTLEECGAYNLILDLIYSREGNLKDDNHEMARLLRCDIRVWKRIRRRLMDLGKLYVHAGDLHNARADQEIDAAQHRLYAAREAGRSSWRTKQEKNNVIKGTSLTAVPTVVPTNYTYKERKKDRGRS
jgi:uncharacterized protein YdaU (DUF1376 family)